MGNFLNRYCLPRLSQDQINNLNRSITSSEILEIIKILTEKNDVKVLNKTLAHQIKEHLNDHPP